MAKKIDALRRLKIAVTVGDGGAGSEEAVINPDVRSWCPALLLLCLPHARLAAGCTYRGLHGSPQIFKFLKPVEAAAVLTPKVLAAMTPDQIKALPAEVLAAMSDEQLACLQPEQLSGLTREQLTKLSPQQLLSVTGGLAGDGNRYNTPPPPPPRRCTHTHTHTHTVRPAKSSTVQKPFHSLSRRIVVSFPLSMFMERAESQLQPSLRLSIRFPALHSGP